MAGYDKTVGESANPRNWFKRLVKINYIRLRMAVAILALVFGAVCFIASLRLAYLNIGSVPYAASILIILAGVLGAAGIRNAFAVITRTLGRRWPAMIALALNAFILLSVIVMYIAGLVLV